MLNKRKRILHVITSLGDGGAEAVLYRLCLLTSADFDHYVISLTGEGKYSEKLRNIKIKTTCLDFRTLPGLMSGIYRLFLLLRKINPDVVQTWMYHADLVGGVVAKICGCKKIVWGIHNTTLKAQSFTNYIVKLLSKLSIIVPNKIICCADSARQLHIQLGYPTDKMVVIPNGINVDDFGCLLRNKHSSGISLGIVARYADQKDHETFLKVLKKLDDQHVKFESFVVGTGVEILESRVRQLGLVNCVHLLGPVDKIQTVYEKIDILVLTSKYGEACPNVLLEALASGVFCVATDVGDCKKIIDKFGYVCSVGDVEGIAEKIMLVSGWLDRKDLQKLRQDCADYIRKNYSLKLMGERYLEVWADER